MQSEAHEENQHTEMQHHLLRIGKALGCDVTMAINDRNPLCRDQKLSFLCLEQHPELPVPADVASTIRLIDIVWFAPGTSRVVAAFEVEKSTGIYSGILRLTDLAFSMPENATVLYLVVPDAREKEAQAQLSCPAIRAAEATIHYILFSELRQHCEALCKFGDSPAATRQTCEKRDRLTTVKAFHMCCTNATNRLYLALFVAFVQHELVRPF